MKNKYLFLMAIIASFIAIPLTLVFNTKIFEIARFIEVVILITRFSGLTAYVILFWLLVTDNQKKWFKLGKFAVYFLAIFHTLAVVAFRYLIGAGKDPLFVYLDVCLYCRDRTDLYYSIGRIGFWIITILALVKIKQKKYYIVSCLLFVVTTIHGYLLGSDFSHAPFVFFAIIAGSIVIYKTYSKISKN